ncbi:3 beta-hydroxysteroid dehydrogenase/delta 5-_4 isomerase [Eptesipox virus]|uniref:3 beta-hydroxysteroid dehydrogenase/Delta 5-->4-isomerase n=1 Tax=Eptesipox virus TaxID=1329402 RepID=A0A220T6L0_9POXV|nr:nucleotide-sugar epimerase [Eptesipox virus]ASK51345.1 3 beta-hydroxysteroid dehydrogenase/delta 5->4 isomerase [Eptesipox virus]WAH71103.1 3 beta-hydroxysteroid dehydrogenase/delta 5->4 isomerase [Eptesipox virus]
MTIYAVTGGNGFIGRAIVQTIIDYDKTATEVRVLDLNHTVVFNTESSSIKLCTIKCDITNYKEFINAVKGVDVLIHSAAIVDVFGKYDENIIYRVNFHGTKNVISACLKVDIPYLIYTSSMEVVGPNNNGEPFTGNEYTYYNSQHTHPYPKSKQAAEKLVLSANGLRTEMGYILKTCALRPTGVYGEGCELLKKIYQKCKSQRNKMFMTVNKGVIHSRVYVGNVAWMHLLISKELINDSRLGGNVYFCYDNSFKCEYDKFNLMILNYLNIKKGKRIPKYLLKCVAKTNNIIHRIYKEYTPMLNSYTLTMANTCFNVCTNKAQIDFNYKPLFSFEEAIHKTVLWLKKEVDGE